MQGGFDSATYDRMFRLVEVESALPRADADCFITEIPRTDRELRHASVYVVAVVAATLD